MLILSRRLGEAFWIRAPDGSEILVSVGRLDSTQVKLGISAPAQYHIVRDELREPLLGEETSRPGNAAVSAGRPSHAGHRRRRE